MSKIVFTVPFYRAFLLRMWSLVALPPRLLHRGAIK
jgi:hypothetical protein